MSIALGDPNVLDALRADEEFLLGVRNLSGILRLTRDEDEFDLQFVNGEPTSLVPARSPIWTARLRGTAQDWDALLNGSGSLASLGRPALGAETEGVALEGDFLTFVTPYSAALRRLVRVLKKLNGYPEPEDHVFKYPFEGTDTATGRYLYSEIDGVRYRIYYEEAGSGTPLLLQHTAGADGRQWRHLLADPQMQERYRMIAYDLPFHGKSLPPLGGTPWWHKEYAPTKEDLMARIVGIKRALDLDRPIFMGTSVGGQLAPDLLAHFPEDFRGAIGINGWYHTDYLSAFSNVPFHHPQVNPEYWGGLMYEATSPVAPEEFRRESTWIYASNGPSVYKGDNQYFSHGHDLRVDGHLIDTRRTPLYALAGEYDMAAHAPGGAAEIARNIPGAQFRELEGLSHFAMSDDPVRFNATLKPILDELDDATRIAVS